MSGITVYSDGGCSGNPGPGGWGYVIVDGECDHAGVATEASCEHRGSGGEHSTTNNRMELTAVIEALRTIEATPHWKKLTVQVFTDSQYVQKGITQWISGWKRNGWRTAAKGPVKNQDLWMRLDELAARLSVEWNWVKGHAGIYYNEICDQLTQQEIALHR